MIIKLSVILVIATSILFAATQEEIDHIEHSRDSLIVWLHSDWDTIPSDSEWGAAEQWFDTMGLVRVNQDSVIRISSDTSAFPPVWWNEHLDNQSKYCWSYAKQILFNPNDSIVNLSKERLETFADFVWTESLIEQENGFSSMGNYSRLRNYGRNLLQWASALDSLSLERMIRVSWTMYGEHKIASLDLSSDVLQNIVPYLDQSYLLFSNKDTASQKLYEAKAWIEKYFSPFSDAEIKPDGLSFHHSMHYNAYMTAYRLVKGSVLTRHAGSPFQVRDETFFNYSFAVRTIWSQYNQNGIMGFPFTGRDNWSRTRPIDLSTLESIRDAGTALGLSDPTLDDYIYKEQNTIPFAPILRQYNYSQALVSMNDRWSAYCKGYAGHFKGAELYNSSGRYSRYLNYGSLDIIYADGTGMLREGFDWNHWPGTISILLPIEHLNRGRAEYDPRQDRPFAGAVAAGSNNGVWGMDFANYDWGHNIGFKKSVFFFDSLIVTTASDLFSDSPDGPLITTLTQRQIDSFHQTAYINGSAVALPTSDTVPAGGSWFMDTWNTGYWIAPGVDANLTYSLMLQSAPASNDVECDPAGFIQGEQNLAYLNFGMSEDTLDGFVTATLPAATVKGMDEFADRMNSATPDFEVLSRTAEAHIVHHPSGNQTGYVLFTSQRGLPGPIIGSNEKAIIMATEYGKDSLIVSVGSPEWVLTEQKPIAKNLEIEIAGKWELSNFHLYSQRPEDDRRSVDAVVSSRTTDSSTVVTALCDYGFTNKLVLVPSASSAIKEVFEIAPVTEFQIAPNPVPADAHAVLFTTPENVRGEWKVTIFDYVGNVIDEQEFVSYGSHLYSWDLTNKAGQPVGSGTYVALISVKQENGEQRLYKKMIGVVR